MDPDRNLMRYLDSTLDIRYIMDTAYYKNAPTALPEYVDFDMHNATSMTLDSTYSIIVFRNNFLTQFIRETKQEEIRRQALLAALGYY